MRSTSSSFTTATISRLVLVTTLLFVVAFVASKTLPTTGVTSSAEEQQRVEQGEQRFVITSKEYSIRDKTTLEKACQEEFGVGSHVVDLDHDVRDHKWDTIIQKFDDVSTMKRFTHYWAKADSDYLDALEKSRGVVVEYLWGNQVEPVLVGDSEMPSFFKVRVLCRVAANSNLQKTPTKKSPKMMTASAYGHFHIDTWDGETTLDFRHDKTKGTTGGSCRFDLLENPNFVLYNNNDKKEDSVGLTIQVRTKSTPMMWSYLEAAVLRIGTQKLQVAGTGDAEAAEEDDMRPRYWVNDDYRGDVSALNFPVEFRTVNARQHVFEIELDNDYLDHDGNPIVTNIRFKTFHKFVRVDIRTTAPPAAAPEGMLQGGHGLLGRFPDGGWMGRYHLDRDSKEETDNDMLDDATEFGMEWIASQSLFAAEEKDEDGDVDQCYFQIIASSSNHHQHHSDNNKQIIMNGQEEESSPSSSSIIGPVTMQRRTLLR